MSEREIEALMLALAYDSEGSGRFTTLSLGQHLFETDGYAPGTAHSYASKVASRLEEAGAIDRITPHAWQITERGRIAAALLMTKQPGLRAAFIDG